MCKPLVIIPNGQGNALKLRTSALCPASALHVKRPRAGQGGPPADGRTSLAGALCCACLCHHMDLLALGYRGRAQHYLAAHAICARRRMFCMPTTGLGATEFFECGLPGGLPCLRLLKMCMCHWGAVHPPRAISCFCVCPCIYFSNCSPLVPGGVAGAMWQKAVRGLLVAAFAAHTAAAALTESSQRYCEDFKELTGCTDSVESCCRASFDENGDITKMFARYSELAPCGMACGARSAYTRSVCRVFIHRLEGGRRHAPVRRGALLVAPRACAKGWGRARAGCTWPMPWCVLYWPVYLCCVSLPKLC